MSRSLEIKIETSLFLEICAYIEDSQVAVDKDLLGLLTEEEKNFIIRSKAESNYHMNEFMVHVNSNDFDTIIRFMAEQTPEKFYYYYHHEAIALDLIKEMDKNILEDLKRLAIEVLKKTRAVVENEIKAIDYEEKLDRVYGMTLKLSPLMTAQEIMGKTFRRVSNYKTYYFIPLHFSHNKASRLFTQETLVQVFPLNDIEKALTVEEMAAIFKIIGDPTRLKIMDLLRNKAMYGKEIADALSIKAPTVSHHIEQLNKIGLLHLEKHGQIKSYSLNHNKYKDLIKHLKRIGDR